VLLLVVVLLSAILLKPPKLGLSLAGMLFVPRTADFLVTCINVSIIMC